MAQAGPDFGPSCLGKPKAKRTNTMRPAEEPVIETPPAVNVVNERHRGAPTAVMMGAGQSTAHDLPSGPPPRLPARRTSQAGRPKVNDRALVPSKNEKTSPRSGNGAAGPSRQVGSSARPVRPTERSAWAIRSGGAVASSSKAAEMPVRPAANSVPNAETSPTSMNADTPAERVRFDDSDASASKRAEGLGGLPVHLKSGVVVNPSSNTAEATASNLRNTTSASENRVTPATARTSADSMSGAPGASTSSGGARRSSHHREVPFHGSRPMATPASRQNSATSPGTRPSTSATTPAPPTLSKTDTLTGPDPRTVSPLKQTTASASSSNASSPMLRKVETSAGSNAAASSSFRPHHASGSGTPSGIASPPTESADLAPFPYTFPYLNAPVPEQPNSPVDRYQVDADRVMNDRSQEDGTFVGPPELDTANLETPRTRKRKADNAGVSEVPYVKPGRGHGHKTRRFNKLKENSEDRKQRTAALESIRNCWDNISETQLMTIPFAPRRSVGQGVFEALKPLDWNTGLLCALHGLALATVGDFARGCDVAREAFEREGRGAGATQLTAEVVRAAVERLHGEPQRRASSSDAALHAVAGALPVSHPASPLASTAMPGVMSPQVSQPNAPPSPVASTPASPIMKVEGDGSTGQAGVSGWGDEISSSQDEFLLAADVRMKKLEYDLALEKEAVAAHRRRQKELKALRMRQYGNSAEDAWEL